MELGSQNHSRDGFLGPNSIIVVYMDPLGKLSLIIEFEPLIDPSAPHAEFQGAGTS